MAVTWTCEHHSDPRDHGARSQPSPTQGSATSLPCPSSQQKPRCCNSGICQCNFQFNMQNNPWLANCTSNLQQPEVPAQNLSCGFSQLIFKV